MLAILWLFACGTRVFSGAAIDRFVEQHPNRFSASVLVRNLGRAQTIICQTPRALVLRNYQAMTRTATAVITCFFSARR
jgi:hypothetical protein